MGIWEKLRLTSGKSTNRSYNIRSVTDERAVPVKVKDGNGRSKISQILRYIPKLAIDSVVDESLTRVIADKIVKEGPKDLNSSTNQNNKLLLLVADEKRARIDKMQENANHAELQTAISTQRRQVLDCFEDLPKEPIKGSNSSKTAPKRIMIRSRL